MAFTNFCCRSGGSNLNAGTRTGDTTEPGTAADFTYASGNWVAGTGVFTVASGNPVTDGVAVGDFASVYPDGSSVAVFIARVTARTSTTITVSLSARAGTAPTDGTGNRTLKIGGAWAGPSAADGFPFNFVASSLTNSSADRTRVNFKNDATYSITAAIAVGGTGGSGGVQYEAYTSNYGDGGRAIIDGGTSGASYVLLTVANTIGGVIKGFEFCNNGATGSADGVRSSNTNSTWIFHDCIAHNVRGNGFSITSGTLARFIECEAYACNQSNTANFGGFRCNGGVAHYIRCYAHDNSGSNASGFVASGGGAAAFCVGCIADTNGNCGFDITSTRGTLIGCDAYNNTSHGIGLLGIGSTTNAYIENCNVVKNGGYGIDCVGGGILTAIIYNCGFGSGTQANTSGQTNITSGTDSVEVFNSVTYAADVTPWVDPANGDFRITLASAKGAGRGTFPGSAGTVGYPDIGAAQHLETGGGGSTIRPHRGANFERVA